jgi:hypothetical protein
MDICRITLRTGVGLRGVQTQLALPTELFVAMLALKRQSTGVNAHVVVQVTTVGVPELADVALQQVLLVLALNVPLEGIGRNVHAGTRTFVAQLERTLGTLRHGGELDATVLSRRLAMAVAAVDDFVHPTVLAEPTTGTTTVVQLHRGCTLGTIRFSTLFLLDVHLAGLQRHVVTRKHTPNLGKRRLRRQFALRGAHNISPEVLDICQQI